MISLAHLAESQWVDAVPGVRLKLAPYDAVHEIAAIQAVREAEGLNHPQLVALEFETQAVQAIEAWEGIEEACTPENIVLAMRHVPGLALAFATLFKARQRPMAEEGNGSNASSSGTSATDQPTAEAAESSAEDAPTASTTRRRSKG